MKAGTCASFCLTVYLLVYTCTAQTIRADVGQTVTLTCQVPDNKIPLIGLEWNRHGLDPEYVLRYQYRRPDPHNQHPSYKNRVDLQDKEMKDGNVSLNVTNVTKNDTGTYECWVFQETKIELISIINLEVRLSGDKDGIIGDGGDMVGLIVVGVIVLAVLAFIVFLIYRGCMRQNPNLSVPTDEAKPTTMSTLSESAEPTTASAPLMDPAAEEQTEM